MSSPLSFTDFLKKDEPEVVKSEENEQVIEKSEAIEESDEIDTENLDVQKAVVEELAADNAEMNVRMDDLSKEVETLKASCQALEQMKAELVIAKEKLEAEKASLSLRNAELERQLGELMNKQFEVQERNPNALALLDRETELPDRFCGETRDHVIEVIREARDLAEKEGRLRRAQLLEGVLVANESSGNLEKKRQEVEKFFNENANILSGPVINELDKNGLIYKHGEQYLLPKEILIINY